MLYLDINEEKTLTFEVEINGVGCEDIRGSVRFIYDNVEYGFPVKIESNKITSVIKPLKELCPSVKNGSIIAARLELNTEQNFFIPWEGEIKIQAPISVEAKLTEEDSNEKSLTIKANIIENKQNTKNKKQKSKWTRERLKNITEKEILAYMTRKGTRNKMVQEVILNEARSKAKSNDNFKVFVEVVKALKKPR